MAKDLTGTLSLIHEMGFREVETGTPQGMTAAQYRAALDAAGLRAVSTGGDFGAMQKNVDEQIADATTLGASSFMVAWIPHNGVFTMADCQGAAKLFNQWAAKVKDSGLQFAYHIHGYEFQPSPDGTLLDTLVKTTDPSLVSLEMDVFWVVWPGQDPIALLKRYPARFSMMHLKDLKKGVNGTQDGHAPEEDSVPLGQGVVDWPVLLGESQKDGVKHYFIEDESPFASQQIPQSLKYLQNLPPAGPRQSARK